MIQVKKCTEVTKSTIRNAVHLYVVGICKAQATYLKGCC